MFKVSVIIPTYKRYPDVVKRAIDSVLNQTYTDFEIIVIDDNAKPEHAEYRKAIAEMIKEYNNEKIIYIQNEKNLGGALARNVGIEKATGEYITFLDDDDKYLPNKIKNQLSYMLENDLDVSFTPIYYCNDKEEVTDIKFHDKLKRFDNEYLLRYHSTRGITPTNTFMYKAEVLKAVGGFRDISSAQEYYLMYDTINGGYKIGYSKECDAFLFRYGQECISTRKLQITKYPPMNKKNFDILNFRERCIKRYNYHISKAVYYNANNKKIKRIFELIIASLSSPLDALNAILWRIRKRKVLQKINYDLKSKNSVQSDI